MRMQTGIGRKKGWIVLSQMLVFVLLAFLPAAHAGQGEAGKAAALAGDAETLFEEGNTDKAIETEKKAAAAEPENPEIIDRLGYMLLSKGDYEGAAAAFSSALKIKPTLRTSKTGIGFVLMKKGDLKAAEEELTAALSLNPYPSMTHYALGLVYEKLNDYEKASAEFKAAIRTYRSGKR